MNQMFFDMTFLLLSVFRCDFSCSFFSLTSLEYISSCYEFLGQKDIADALLFAIVRLPF